MGRPATSRISRRDWIGDAVLTIVVGGAALAAVFLPWANTDDGGSFNGGLGKPAGIRGVLQTHWGWQALLLAVLVVAAGALMVALGPRRLSVLAGVLVAVAGAAMVAVASDASSQMGFGVHAGVGLVVSLFAGLLLVPIGLASSAVALVLRYQARQTAAAAAPPSGSPTGPA
jgi:hypothetical protein